MGIREQLGEVGFVIQKARHRTLGATIFQCPCGISISSGRSDWLRTAVESHRCVYTEVGRLLVALRSIAALHVLDWERELDGVKSCACCDEDWPCRTVRAIEESCGSGSPREGVGGKS